MGMLIAPKDGTIAVAGVMKKKKKHSCVILLL